MSEIEAIEQILGAVARRRCWQSALNGLCLGFFAGGCFWLAALAVFKILPISYLVVRAAAVVGGLLTVVLFVRGWLQKPTLVETARWVDAREHLQERLSTALEWTAARGDGAWRALLLGDAARFAREIDPRKLAPVRLPRAGIWAGLALVLGVGLGFAPEYRSRSFLEKQQDAQIIKDAGKQLVLLTRQALERHPPALEQTKKALQAAEETGLRLDQHPLTRNDALRDLANVADKLENQLKDMGEKNPVLKSLENAENRALDNLDESLQKAEQSMEAASKDDSPEARAAREKMAQTLSDIAKQGQQISQPMPALKQAVSDLQANQTENLQRDLNQAVQDIEKQRSGKDLSEQLKNDHAGSAGQSLQKMKDDLRSGKLSSEQMAGISNEIARAISPAAPYVDAGKFLRQADTLLKKNDKSGAAQALGKAGDELQKAAAQANDAKELAESVEAVNKAEQAIATRQSPGPGQSASPPAGAQSDDSSQLYSQQSSLWDNTGLSRSGPGARGQTDRGEPRLADNLAPTRARGQISPGAPMPSLSLKGVSIKGQSGVAYQEAAAAAQTDAQNALNQDQVPRAYQGAVRDYFDDLKK